MNAKLARIKWMRTLGNFSYMLGAAFLVASLAVNAFPAGPALAKNNNTQNNNTGGNVGAIWTTTGSCGSPVDANHYQVGEVVYINGSGFDAGDHTWQIKGQPGGASGDPGDVVASGTVTVDASGAFCFAAYTVQADDWGEYAVKVGNKGDNYNVSAATATPTDEATATPTDEPTQTPTATPTDQPGEPTATPTETGDPMATPTPHPTERALSLKVSSFCGPNSDELNWWKIENKDASDATIVWKVMPLGTPTDTYFLPGHSTYKFSTPKNSAADKLYVYDILDNLVDTASAASNCQRANATPTAVPSNPNPAPSTSQSEVLIPVTGADLTAGSGVPAMFFNLGIGFLGLGLVLNGVARQRKSWDL
jgi:hypothetical protein